MRLYLSSFRLGNRPDLLLGLLRGGILAAVVTNADDYKTPDEQVATDSYGREAADLAGLGLEPVRLDLRDYAGRPAELEKALSGFDLLWVRGGNVFILRRAFRYSGADEVIPRLLTEDRLVYAGYSAGACILTPDLRGIDLVDDPSAVPDGYDPEVIWDCLGVLPFNLLPHYKSDHPESEAIGRVADDLIEHHVPFVALRDGQVLVRDGDRQFVAG